MFNLSNLNWAKVEGLTNNSNLVFIQFIKALDKMPDNVFVKPLFIVSNNKISDLNYVNVENDNDFACCAYGNNIVLVYMSDIDSAITQERSVLLYNIAYNKQYTVDEFNDAMFDLYIESYIKNKYKNERQQLERDNLELKQLLARYKQDILTTSHKLAKNEVMMNSNIEETYIGKVKEEIKNIKDHKKCKNVYFETDSIMIETEYLYITEPETGKMFDLGNCKIELNLNTLGVRLFNLTRTVNGFWQDSPHPHVNGNGDPCFGNTSGQISVYLGDNDIYACYLLMLGYLQTCDICDSAGITVGCWDEVDKDGNVINSANGSYRELSSDGSYYNEYGDDWEEDEEEPEQIRIGICNVCGEDIYEDDSCYTCNVCGEIVCGDCCVTVDGKIVCNDCYDDATFDCAECGGTFLRENSYNSDNEFLCKDCYERESNTVEEAVTENEDEVAPENVVRCGICGQVDAESNMHNIGNGAYLCDVCYQQTEVN